jgi:predicted metal-binding membrane protein
MSAAVGTRSSTWLDRFSWHHPEWWTYAVALAAWLAMSSHVYHGQHAHHSVSPLLEVVNWLLMIAAMMLPLQSEQMRWVAFRSYARTRQRTLAAFVAGYLATWFVAGAPVVAIRAAGSPHPDGVAAIAFLIAGVWALAPARERAAQRCHFRRGLMPLGWRALVDAANFGRQISVHCVITCWPLMLACTLTGHHPVAMIGGFAIAVFERYSFRRSPRKNAIGPLLLACYSGFMLLSPGVQQPCH